MMASKARTPGALPAAGANNPWFVLGLLFAAYMFSFVDRQILSILFEPIREEMGFSDTQLGFLGGMAFAVFYATLGVPIAMLADRTKRTRIITASLVVFSFMTAVCGMAQSFIQLALARVGVGVGEAGVTPASHSMIADLFPEERRSAAMGVLGTGANIGMMFGLVVGGSIGAIYGWRVAMVVVGLPGLLLALVFWLTVREPERGTWDAVKPSDDALPFRDVLRHMWEDKAMRHVVFGTTLAGTAGLGVSAWMPSFLIRSHGLDLTQVGILLALLIGVGGGAGTLMGGVLNDLLSRKKAGLGLFVLGVIMLAVYPLAAAAYLTPSLVLAVCFFIIPVVAGNIFFAPAFATAQSLSRPRMRAVVASLMLLAINLIGMGVGPQAVGILSDLLRARLGDDSLRVAITAMSSLSAFAGIHYIIASRHIKATESPVSGR